MIDAPLDLSIETLMRACKGNVDMLPSFMVHDNDVWPSNAIRPDSKGRIHMRRAVFLRQVSSQLPMRAGLWHRIDLQEFHIDLQPHHLQGSTDQRGGNILGAARAVAKTDKAGRSPGDMDYGKDLQRDHRATDIASDVADIKARGEGGGVGTTILTPDRPDNG